MILKVLDKPPKNAKPLINKTIEVPDPEYKGKTKKLTVRLDIDHNDLNQIVKLTWTINGKAGKKSCPDGITLEAWHSFEDAVRKEVGEDRTLYGDYGKIMRMRKAREAEEIKVQRVPNKKGPSKKSAVNKVQGSKVQRSKKR